MRLPSGSGVAPVTKQSRRRLVVVMRQACNGRLRNAVYRWARVAVTRDPRSTEVHDLLRARGQSHGRALRSVADRLLRLLIAVLKRRTPSTRRAGPTRSRRRPPRSRHDPGNFQLDGWWGAPLPFSSSDVLANNSAQDRRLSSCQSMCNEPSVSLPQGVQRSV
jgi:hypothetical protein